MAGQGSPCQASIIVVSYGTRELTRACLQSVSDNTKGISYEVIVVDNGSADGSAAMIADQFPGVRLIELDHNVGFAAGANLAAQEARGDFLVFLNPDALVLDDAVEKLVDFAKAHPEAGIVGGRALAPDGSVDRRSCRGLPSLWGMACYGLGLSTAFKNSNLFDPESLGPWPRDSVREVGYVTGCFMAVRRSLWERLGGFDSRYFLYSEDVDLAVRARDLGYSSMVTPDAAVVHHFGASSADGAAKGILLLSGRATFIRKNWAPPARQFGLAMLWLGAGLRQFLASWSRPVSGKASPWPEIWSQREHWMAGY